MKGSSAAFGDTYRPGSLDDDEPERTQNVLGGWKIVGKSPVVIMILLTHKNVHHEGTNVYLLTCKCFTRLG